MRVITEYELGPDTIKKAIIKYLKDTHNVAITDEKHIKLNNGDDFNFILKAQTFDYKKD